MLIVGLGTFYINVPFPAIRGIEDSTRHLFKVTFVNPRIKYISISGPSVNLLD